MKISQILPSDSLLEWTIKPKWNTSLPLDHVAYVLYEHYLLTFGGAANFNGVNDIQYQDGIYLLDLDRDDGWQELEHIVCPIPSNYLATLTPDNYVHLFLTTNKYPNMTESETGHYSIPIKDLMGKYYPYRFDLGALKYIDSATKDIVYGYFRIHLDEMEQISPKEVMNVCLLYYFD